MQSATTRPFTAYNSSNKTNKVLDRIRPFSPKLNVHAGLMTA